MKPQSHKIPAHNTAHISNILDIISENGFVPCFRPDLYLSLYCAPSNHLPYRTQSKHIKCTRFRSIH